MKIKYPLAKDTIPKEDIASLIEWLKSDPKLTKGELTEKFEAKWAKLIGRKYAVFCNSGSSANLLAADALLRNKKYRGIVLPSIGWSTTVSPFLQLQHDAELYMVDGDVETFGVDPTQIADLCKRKLVDLVVVVNVLGVPAKWDDLLYLQKRYGFDILEDNCASVGSKSGDAHLGSFGKVSTFSFFYGHQYSTIEGGMVVTDDERLYYNLLMLRSHGWGKDLPAKEYDALTDFYDIDDFAKPFTFFIPGYNLRATDLQAFLGLLQLKRYESWAKARHANHLKYMGNLSLSYRFQQINSEDRIASISVGVLAPAGKRKVIVENLIKNGIETRLFSAGNLAKHPFVPDKVRIYPRPELPTANSIHSDGFFLPNYVSLKKSDINFISEVVIDATSQ